MTVDGGKSISSRGQTNWYGWQYMNRKFEQEETQSYLNYKVNKEAIKPIPTHDLEALEDWTEEVQVSTWAI